ncbi:DUF4365 domain-containing protein [Agromyces albus]|uniref:DUF4365 domain-containing protein n=1 Tax=Agromyces albus TaxID=205332 RepID=UPI00277D4324|nr:DUF4365 domain-containing protein [Agromyces albus]MDQ0575235.1 hypothetical protein [Agromyces albus]
MAAKGSKEMLAPHQTLTLNARKGRYGVAYLRAVAGQAGCNFYETSPGEDVLAVDCLLEYPESNVRVQVKTTKRYAIDGTDAEITYSADEKWIAKWAASALPVYFVVVVVPDDSAAWLNHDNDGTHMVRTAAYWVRIDPADFVSSKSIRIPRGQRLDAATIALWHDDLRKLYTPAEVTA